MKNSQTPIPETGDINQLLHELKVHQIELETQNEELRSAQTKVSELKERYKELFLHAPVGYVVLDNNLIITGINRKGTDLLGEPEEYLLGTPLHRYVHSSSRKILYRHLEELQLKGHTGGCEIKLSEAGAFEVWMYIESTLLTSESDNKRRLLVTLLDITDKKQKDMEIKQSRKKYSDIVETANSIIAKMDTEGRLSFLNQYALDFFGFDREETIGKPIIGTILPEEDGAGKKWSELLEDMLEHPDVYQDQEAANIKADGTPVWIHWRNKATVDPDGRVTGILGIGRDITDQRIAEEIIKRDNEQLEAKVEERTKQLLQTQNELELSRRLADLGRLSSAVAHELRRPLAAIKLSTYNIRKKRTNPEIDKNLNHCEEKIAEADEIISSILKSYSLKKPELREIDLWGMVSEALDRFESTTLDPQKANNTTTIKRNLAPLYSVTVEADPVQIKEVIYHIVKNAFEASGWDPEKVSVVGFNTDKAAGFKVIDSDMGIPKDEIPMVTEPFYTTKHQGLGLGLTIAQEMINCHNGTLEIESSLGAGTTVTVSFPKKNNS